MQAQESLAQEVMALYDDVYALYKLSGHESQFLAKFGTREQYAKSVGVTIQ